MRILEETKDYIIYYQPDPIKSGDIFCKDTFFIMYGFLIDKNTKTEYHHQEKCDDNNLNETIIKSGKNLIKKWKHEKISPK